MQKKERPIYMEHLPTLALTPLDHDNVIPELTKFFVGSYGYSQERAQEEAKRALRELEEMGLVKYVGGRG